jgi:hypothetical protein
VPWGRSQCEIPYREGYEVVVRRGEREGKLTFSFGSVEVNTTCWWDADLKVDAGVYWGYATRMANKNDGVGGGKRQAVWLGKDVPSSNNTKRHHGIFIHKGTSAAWSDGCIVIPEAEVMKIWNAVHPKEYPVIKVRIEDE